MRIIAAFTLSALLLGAPAIWSAEIHEAVETGDLAVVQQLLGGSPDLLEARDDDGQTPLLRAAGGGQVAMLQYLLDQGANLHAITENGSTALNLAAYGGHTDAAEFLIGKGIDVNVTTPRGFTPLLHAVYAGQPATAEFLIAKGADMTAADMRYGGSAVHWACNRGDTEMLAMLARHGADFNRPCAADSSTPIFWASFAGKAEAIDFLCDNGVGTDATMPDGWTPLHNAAREGHQEAAHRLIQRGFAVDAASRWGSTPLLAAVERGHIELAAMLLANGADVNHTYSGGASALHVVWQNGGAETIAFLLANGADVNATDDYGTTPLQNAMWSGDTLIAAMLIRHGAEINNANAEGVTPLCRAVMRGHNDMIGLLLDAGARLDQRDRHYDRTELHWATIKGNTPAVEMLLDHGADVNAVDRPGRTPLYYAGRYGHRDVAEFLAERGGAASDLVENYGRSQLLDHDMDPGEAVVWYLGNCGFAIRTNKTVLIFDYWNHDRSPAAPGLTNGNINPAEIADKDVYVFCTHDHADHFDTTIFAWDDALNNATYIYGFDPALSQTVGEAGYNGPPYVSIGPREHRTVGDLDITTIEANDAGVGFLVTVDGLTLYHAGDHAGWREGQRDGYTQEIDYLAERTDNLDLAFLNVTGCHTGDTTALFEAVMYTMDKLHPKCWFPTHGSDREYAYETFTAKVAGAGCTSTPACAENRGDWFVYRGGVVAQ